MDAQDIAELFKPMNATQIISTLETLEQSGANLTSVDLPAVISQLNITQVEGILASDSKVVNGLLQSLNPSQMFTVVSSFQNLTSNLFRAAANSNNTEAAKAYYSTGSTLVTLLMKKIETVFTNAQLLGMFKLMTNGAAFGTGSKKLIFMAKNLVAGFFAGNTPSGVGIPSRLEVLVSDYQPAIFGDYPNSTDVAPSAIFLSIFALITIAHSSLFIKNYTLGHKFFISLGLAFYSLMRTLSFILRLVWAKNLLNLDLGLTSTIFLVLCTIFLPTLNLILAQRYFTWRHPLYGSHKIFMTLMYIIYTLVLGVIVMTIIAACVQTIYLLSEKHFHMTKQVIQASSILILVYSLIAAILVVLAFVIPPTKKDRQLLTYQPYWIKSFSWNYFVPKGIAQKEEQLVSTDQKHAIRVINSTSYHYETIHDPSAQGDHQLHHTSSIFIIASTTILLLIADIFRTVSTFINQYHYEQSWIFNHVVMYVMFGVLEVVINAIYLISRIDLRFYKPDSLKDAILSKGKSNGEASQEEKAIESTASEDN